MKRRFILLTFVFLIIGGCHLFNKISYQNYSFIYNYPSEKNPEYLLFHRADSITFLYFKVNTLNLHYLKEPQDGHYYSNFKLKLETYVDYSSKVVLDSFCKQYSDSGFAFQNKELVFLLKITLKKEANVLKASFYDENSGTVAITFVDILKKDQNSRQNYMLVNSYQETIFSSIISGNQPVRICSNDALIKCLYVSCYFREFPIAGPPFSNPKGKPYVLKSDSNFTLEMLHGISSPIKLKRKGIYHFRKDTTSLEGITLFHFYDDFPEITSPQQMLPPIRYISSKKEYNEIVLSKDKKLGIEAFWLQTAENSEKAAALIKKYYNRVREANMFFSSYQEGWKTDRGEIYIIYGPPGVVYKTNNMETWIYGEENNRLSTRFYFYKVTNRFTENDYSLNKSEIYRDSWYMAMDTWRK